MKSFNVLIEDNDKFKPYDIMPYLERKWKDFVKQHFKILIEDPNYFSEGKDIYGYWKYPYSFDEIRDWVDRELRYQYWARCEYELILSPWPSYTNENNEDIIRIDKCRKIDIYEQCQMNLDIITQLFIEEIYK